MPAFVIIGGGEAGRFYVRQLLRAVEAGRLMTERLVVVDRDPRCLASLLADSRLRLAVGDWAEWLDRNLEPLGPEAHLVPYHWAPHLLVDWLARQAKRAGAHVGRGGEIPPRGVPLERETADGDRALSYATWICPPTCIEPALCPHTCGPRDWSLASDLEAGRPAGGLGAQARSGGSPRGPSAGIDSRREPPDDPFDERIVFRCLHLVYGVGTIAVADILRARDRMTEGLEAGPRDYLVATSSHCHALATRLRLEPRSQAR